MDDMLKGALVQVGLKSISHFAFIAARAMGVPDADLRANPWYSFPIPGVNIPTDDFVTCLGVPAGMLVGSKIIKDPRKSEALKKMTTGSLLTGGAVMLDHVIMQAGPKLMPPVGHRVAGRPTPPYARDQQLPFQSDLSW